MIEELILVETFLRNKRGVPLYIIGQRIDRSTDSCEYFIKE